MTTGTVYTVDFTAAASKQIKALEAGIRTRILARIYALAFDPRPPGSKKLEGHAAYRVRVGDYRVIYTI